MSAKVGETNDEFYFNPDPRHLGSRAKPRVEFVRQERTKKPGTIRADGFNAETVDYFRYPSDLTTDNISS